VEKEDEIQCLIYGCNFLLKNIPDEAFLYHRHGNPDYCFQGVDQYVFPYLLVNIGSGVSLVMVSWLLLFLFLFFFGSPHFMLKLFLHCSRVQNLALISKVEDQVSDVRFLKVFCSHCFM
jgi:hypothetical protein